MTPRRKPKNTTTRGKVCQRGHDMWRQNKTTGWWFCVPCKNTAVRNHTRLNAEANRARTRAWRIANPEKWDASRRDNWYRRRYGITLTDYEQMLRKQKGVCALCGSPPKRNRLAVDHHHGEGNTRELLCNSCNRGLSFLENPKWFRKAQRYITKHNPERKKS